MSKPVDEASLNQMLSYMENNDIAAISSIRSNPESSFYIRINKDKNNKLEDELNYLGYNGFIKVAVYWDKPLNNPNYRPIAEESYIVLNSGSSFIDFATDTILMSKYADTKNYDTQVILVWDHRDKKAYLYDTNGNVINTTTYFSIDAIIDKYPKLGNYNLIFFEESISKKYSEIFKHNRSWLITADIENRRSRFRRNKKRDKNKVKELFF